MRRHPLEWNAASALMGLVELPEAERWLETNRAALGELEFHRTRAAIRRKHRAWPAAVADRASGAGARASRAGK